MSWLETFRTGVNGVRSHRLRSFLTVLGILIGIAGVIIAVGLGEGASGQVTSEINALGSNVLTVTPGSSTSSTGVREALGSASTLTMADVVGAVLPRRRTRRQGGGRHHLVERGADGRAARPRRPPCRAPTPSWLTVRGRTLAEGRFLDNEDVKDHTAVAVLGATTASELFSREDPVGQTVDVNGVPVTVVGVLTSTGASSFLVEHLGPRRHLDHPDHDGRRAHLRRHVAQLGQLHRRPGPLVGRPDRAPTRRPTTCCSSCTGPPTRPTPTSPSPRRRR